MKKQLIVGSALLALSLVVKADSFGSVNAYTSLDTAIELGQAQNKMLFIMTGTTWCPHCTDLKNAIAQLSSEVNANFVVYYCNADRDKTMPSAAGYPHWGIYNPFTFVPSKRWSNKDEFYEDLGFSKLEVLQSALASAVAQWPNASKVSTNGYGSGTSASSDSGSSSSSDSGSSSSTVRKRIKTTETASSLAFYISATDFPSTIRGNTVLEQFLPTTSRPEAAELTSKLKMETEKAAKIAYNRKKGLTVSDENGNLSGLKLTYNKSKKTFKGSFRIYTQSSRGTLKKYTAKFSDGTYKNGVGYATASIPGMSYKWDVVLEAIAE